MVTTTTMNPDDDHPELANTTTTPGLLSLEQHSILDDDDDEGMSDGSDTFENSQDLMSATMEDEVTAQLAAAGPVGMAAAAAIASAKKRKRPHSFETNPSIRKRQQTRLLRKLRQTIDEFTIRVGMQAIVLVTIPGKPQNSFKVFGAKPLEDVIRTLRPTIMADLESSLAAHAPPPLPEDPSLHELPPLVIDGIPTPVEKMTQAQLRAFIPLMLKYSTGRGKPGWGKESTRPPWWPQDLPWANVRMDARTDDEKQKVSWTHALRQIVINCYKYHGRDDLLPVFSGEPTTENDVEVKPILKKAEKMYQICEFLKPQEEKYSLTQSGSSGLGTAHYGNTVLQTISNPDGTVSIIQVDPTNSIITLPDGTTAQVQGVATIGGPGSEDPDHQNTVTMSMDMSQLSHAVNEGQIILTAEDGHAYPVTVSGMITVPYQSGMYSTMVAGLQQDGGGGSGGQIQPKYTSNITSRKSMAGGGAVAAARRQARARQAQAQAQLFTITTGGGEDMVTPMVLPKVEPGTEGEMTTIPVSALTGDPSQTQLVTVNANGQVIHNDKVYQICEFLKPDGNGHDKIVMMAQVTSSHLQQLEQQQQEIIDQQEQHQQQQHQQQQQQMEVEESEEIVEEEEEQEEEQEEV